MMSVTSDIIATSDFLMISDFSSDVISDVFVG